MFVTIEDYKKNRQGVLEEFLQQYQTFKDYVNSISADRTSGYYKHKKIIVVIKPHSKRERKRSHLPYLFQCRISIILFESSSNVG